MIPSATARGKLVAVEQVKEVPWAKEATSTRYHQIRVYPFLLCRCWSVR